MAPAAGNQLAEIFGSATPCANCALSPTISGTFGLIGKFGGGKTGGSPRSVACTRSSSTTSCSVNRSPFGAPLSTRQSRDWLTPVPSSKDGYSPPSSRASTAASVVFCAASAAARLAASSTASDGLAPSLTDIGPKYLPFGIRKRMKNGAWSQTGAGSSVSVSPATPTTAPP